MMHQSHAREVTCHFQGPASCTGPCDFTEKPFPSTGSSIPPLCITTTPLRARRDLLHPLICDRSLIPLCPTDDIIEEQCRFFFSLPRLFRSFLRLTKIFSIPWETIIARWRYNWVIYAGYLCEIARNDLDSRNLPNLGKSDKFIYPINRVIIFISYQFLGDNF